MKLGAVIRKDFSQLIFVFLSFGLMVLVSYLFASSIVEKQLFVNTEKTLETAEVILRADLREAEVALLNTEIFVHEIQRKGLELEETQRYLAQQIDLLSLQENQVRGLLDIYLCINDTVITGSGWKPPAGYEPSTRSWYADAIRGDGSINITLPYIDTRTGKNVITMVKSIPIDGQEEPGVIGMDIDFTLLSKYVINLQFVEGGYGVLADQHFRFMVHPFAAYVDTPMEETNQWHARAAAEFRNKDITVFSIRMTNWEGIEVILLYRRLYNGWLLGIAMPVTHYYEAIYTMALTLSIMGFICMITLCIFLIRMSILKARSDEENRGKSSFLARMSHEIRTPMNSILGMVEIIQRKSVSSEIQEYAGIISQSGNTLLSIINDILDFSKIESGRLNIEHRNYHLSSVINDIINVIRPRAAEKSLDFFVYVDSALPAELTGDDVRLRQILLNLLSNAVKYTQKGFVSLNIGLEKLNENVIRLICTVEDSGIGIKSEDIGRLFIDFSRIDTKPNQKIEGTGLGLVITRALCRFMGGDVTVSSVYESGSVFQAVIIQNVEQHNPLAKVTNPQEKRVLFYDWRIKNVKYISKTLTGLGVAFHCPENYTNFLHELEQGDYNYVFISSKYAMDSIYALSKRKVPLHLVAMVEAGEILTFREMSSILMPVYSAIIANALNGDIEELPSEQTKLKVRFTAPDANVLIVDDISTNLRVAKELMTPYNMNVQICLSGPEAIALIQANQYDLVFMDHMMPGMDGIEATAFIRQWEQEDIWSLADNETGPHLPIIALTANAITGQREMFLEKGIDDFLAKPIDINKLNDILEKWIPAEKRIESVKLLEEVVPEKTTENIVIPGVDVAAGLRNTGGVLAIYLDILTDFCRDTESRIPKISEALDTGNTKLYVTLVHAIKGAARSIGAAEAGEAAWWLEKAAEKEAPPLIKSKTAELIERLLELVGHIRNCLLQVQAGKEGQSGLSSLRLEDLKAALTAMDIESVNKMLLDYANLSLDAETKEFITALEDHILMFEYDEAVKKIEAVLTSPNSLE
ncbi:MAG: response regulator [Treponema sp.]|jgi:signal transduction histidine kinase/CheY-like chemotaxis protein/HPt (histidine-containing phosphotransfer) domain-containing protein|nr:response regulator [Treponema sp.]